MGRTITKPAVLCAILICSTCFVAMRAQNPVFYLLNQSSSTPNIPQPTAWYSADCTTYSGSGMTGSCSHPGSGTIGTWDDRSGNSHTANQASGSCTIGPGTNGQPGITFATSGGFGCVYNVGSAIPAGTSRTVFVVFENATTAGKGDFTSAGSTFESFTYWSCKDGKEQGADSTSAVQLGEGTAPCDTSWHQIDVTEYDADSVPGFSITFNIDGVADPASTTSSGNAGASPPFDTIGRNGVVSGENFSGELAELIWYNSALTSTQVTQVESYLLAKYGL